MLLTAVVLALQTKPAVAEPRVWEKLVVPGVTFRMEVDPATPRLINAVRFTPGVEGLAMVGELAAGNVYDESDTRGRETVTQTAYRTGSVVAVNADFFPFTGDPLGAMVIGGELVSLPQPGRAALCWGNGYSQIAYLSCVASFKFEEQVFPITGLNQECADEMVAFNTPRAGFAESKMPATHVVVSFPQKLAPDGSWTATVLSRIENAESLAVREGEAVLTFRGSMAEKLQFLNAGDTIEVRFQCTGADWTKATDVIAGGPHLVKAGKAVPNYAAEGFTDAFGKSRHPRSAMGITAKGDVWIVAVDGRQSVSAGATIQEMADLMVRFGCVEAINLDGGGSTTLNIEGLTVNRPSEGSERAVANALLVVRTAPVPPSSPDGDPSPVIAGAASVKVGEAVRYRVVDATGADVPAAEVLWSAQGSAWVDQGGFLHGLAEGTCQLRALARGRTASLTVSVEKPGRS